MIKQHPDVLIVHSTVGEGGRVYFRHCHLLSLSLGIERWLDGVESYVLKLGLFIYGTI